MVCTFANVLGCRFQQANIGSHIEPQFTLRRHEKIGLKWEDDDEFNYHAVAWFVDRDEVSDACLKLDSGGNLRLPPKPLFASNLSFAGNNGYRHLLVSRQEERNCGVKETFFRSIGSKDDREEPEILNVKLVAMSLIEFFKRLSAIDGWYLADVRLVPYATIEGYWKRSDDSKNRILRLDAQVSTTDKAADANLSDQLKRFELPGITLKAAAGFGEEVFANESGSTILFSRSRLTLLLRNVGSEATELWTVARLLDVFIRSL
jgi:hypothetical protein